MKMSKKEMCYKVKDKTSMKMTGKQSVATEIKFKKKKWGVSLWQQPNKYKIYRQGIIYLFKCCLNNRGNIEV